MKYLLLVLVIFYIQKLSYATICKPNSKFKVDCDSCTCSEDGTKYHCTNKNCSTKYDIEAKPIQLEEKGKRKVTIPIPYSAKHFSHYNEDRARTVDHLQNEQFLTIMGKDSKKQRIENIERLLQANEENNNNKKK